MRKFFSLSSLRKSQGSQERVQSTGNGNKRLSIGSNHSLSSRQSISIEVIRDGYNVDLSRVDQSFSKLHRDCLQNRPLKKLQTHLRRQRAYLNQLDNVAGCAPLHLAVVNGNTGHVRALISHGAQIELPDRQGKTPLIKAIECKSELVELLLQLGADPNQPDNRLQNSPLHWAAMQMRPDAFNVLLRASRLNAAVTSLNASGQTCLHLLASNSSRHWSADGFRSQKTTEPTSTGLLHRLITQLVARGCPVNQQDECGSTALHQCVTAGGQLETLVALLDVGCDVSITNVSGQTACQLAEHLGLDTLVNVLMRSRPVERRPSFAPLIQQPNSALSHDDSSWPDSDSEIDSLPQSKPFAQILGVSSAAVGAVQQTSSQSTKMKSPTKVAYPSTSQSDEFDSDLDSPEMKPNGVKNMNEHPISPQHLTNGEQQNVQKSENDAFIQQMRQLIEEEIDMNEELDQMLMTTETKNKISPKTPTLINSATAKNNKSATSYIFESDEDEEIDDEIKRKAFGQPNLATVNLAHSQDVGASPVNVLVATETNANQKHIVYGLSDDEQDDQEEQRLLSNSSWFSDDKESPQFQHHLTSPLVIEAKDSSIETKPTEQVSEQLVENKSSEQLNDKRFLTLDSTGQADQSSSFAIGKEINRKLHQLNQLQDVTPLSNYIIEVPEKSSEKSNPTLSVVDGVSVVESGRDDSKFVGQPKESSDLHEQRLFVKDQQIELLKSSIEQQVNQAKQLEQRCNDLDFKCRQAVDRTEELQAELFQTSSTLEQKQDENERLQQTLKQQQQVEHQLRQQCEGLKTQVDQQHQQIRSLNEQLTKAKTEFDQFRHQNEQFLAEMQQERDKFIAFIRNEQQLNEQQLRGLLEEKQSQLELLQKQLDDTRLELLDSNETVSSMQPTEEEIETLQRLQIENQSLRQQLSDAEQQLNEVLFGHLNQGQQRFQDRQQQNQQLMDNLQKLGYVIEQMEQQLSGRLQEHSLLDSELVQHVESLIVNKIQDVIGSQMDRRLESIGQLVSQLKTQSSPSLANTNNVEEDKNDFEDEKQKFVKPTDQVDSKVSDPPLQQLYSQFEHFIDSMEQTVRQQIHTMAPLLVAMSPPPAITNVTKMLPDAYATQFSNPLLRLISNSPYVETPLPGQSKSQPSMPHSSFGRKLFAISARHDMPTPSALTSSRRRQSLQQTDLKWVANFKSVNRSLDQSISNLKNDLGLCSPVV